MRPNIFDDPSASNLYFVAADLDVSFFATELAGIYKYAPVIVNTTLTHNVEPSSLVEYSTRWKVYEAGVLTTTTANSDLTTSFMAMTQLLSFATTSAEVQIVLEVVHRASSKIVYSKTATFTAQKKDEGGYTQFEAINLVASSTNPQGVTTVLAITPTVDDTTWTVTEANGFVSAGCDASVSVLAATSYTDDYLASAGCRMFRLTSSGISATFTGVYPEVSAMGINEGFCEEIQFVPVSYPGSTGTLIGRWDIGNSYTKWHIFWDGTKWNLNIAGMGVVPNFADSTTIPVGQVCTIAFQMYRMSAKGAWNIQLYVNGVRVYNNNNWASNPINSTPHYYNHDIGYTSPGGPGWRMDLWIGKFRNTRLGIGCYRFNGDYNVTAETYPKGKLANLNTTNVPFQLYGHGANNVALNPMSYTAEGGLSTGDINNGYAATPSTYIHMAVGLAHECSGVFSIAATLNVSDHGGITNRNVGVFTQNNAKNANGTKGGVTFNAATSQVTVEFADGTSYSSPASSSAFGDIVRIRVSRDKNNLVNIHIDSLLVYSFTKSGKLFTAGNRVATLHNITYGYITQLRFAPSMLTFT